MTDFVSVTDTAELLGISLMSVRRWASEGKIDARRMGGQWRIVKSAVQNLLGLAVRADRDGSSLPHAHQILNPWIEQRRVPFQNYIHSHIELFQPDLLILVDRKGRLDADSGHLRRWAGPEMHAGHPRRSRRQTSEGDLLPAGG